MPKLKTNDLIDVRAFLRFREFIVAALGTSKPCKKLETSCKIIANDQPSNHASKQAKLQNLANRSRHPAKSHKQAGEASKPCKPLETSCKVAASEPTRNHAPYRPFQKILCTGFLNKKHLGP